MFCVLMSSQGVSFGPKEEEKKTDATLRDAGELKEPKKLKRGRERDGGRKVLLFFFLLCLLKSDCDNKDVGVVQRMKDVGLD